jgi:hypothetical protein
MSSEHFEHDPVLVAIASLRARDVGARHADRLRGSCHALLENRPRRNPVEPMLARTSLRRIVPPALASAWCVVYLWEILHRAAAVYGH